jgi:hypothetical protein
MIEIKKFTPTFSTKPIKFSATAAFSAEYGSLLEISIYIREILKALEKRPVDMYVFEEIDGVMSIRCAGYVMPDDCILDEATIIKRFSSLPTKTFWCKIDEYKDHYRATFLFPEDY